MASESVCRGWHRVNVDGEITGGCGKCRRCCDAAKIYLKRAMVHARDLRNAANRLLQELETGYEIPRKTRLDDLIGEMGRAIRSGRAIHNDIEDE